MKRIVAVILTLVLAVLGVAPAFSAIPPWYLKDEDKIMHPEGVDEDDPRFAYDENGVKYGLNQIYCIFSCGDFEEAKQYFAALKEYAENLPGVAEVISSCFNCPPEVGTGYDFFVMLEEPYYAYNQNVLEALKNYPGLDLVSRAYMEDIIPIRLTYGDVDFDDKVTAADARQILRFSVSLEVPEDYHISFGDLDADGLLTAADARSCLRTAVGLDATRYYWTSAQRERQLAAQNAPTP